MDEVWGFAGLNSELMGKTNKCEVKQILWELTEQSSQAHSLGTWLGHLFLEGEISAEGKEMKTSNQRVLYIFCFLVSFKLFEFDKHSYHIRLGLTF